jgi:hypothetical protein
MLVLLGAALVACGGEEPQPSGAPLARAKSAPALERDENQPPVVERLVLHPQRPLPGQQLEARIEVADPDGDPIRLTLEWRQNGRVLLRGAQTTLAPDRLEKGDQIEVWVTATDGSAESEPLRASVQAGNQAPLIEALYLAPDGEVRPGQEVTAAPQAKDPDGDTLEYEFSWLLNGRPVRGADRAALDTSKLTRGDRLQARVRVFDGEAWSPLAESMTLSLANRAPHFSGVPPIASSAGLVQAEFEAEDPDGDRSLRFRVLEGPAGLSIDPLSGKLSWRPGPEAAGTHAVELAVADSFGAESALRFELDVVSGTSAAPPAKPAPSEEMASESDDEDDEPAEAAEVEEDEEPLEAEQSPEGEE